MSYKNRYSFIAVFNYAEDGISISFPDLPGCYPCAETEEEAIKNAQEALGLHIWGIEQDKEIVPEPTHIKDIVLETGDVPVLIEVFMPPIRERINNRFVKKTLSLPAWLAEAADRDKVNYSKLLQSALMEHLDVTPPKSSSFQRVEL